MRPRCSFILLATPQDFAATDAQYPPEWLSAHNAIHLPVLAQPIVAAYNLGSSAPANGQALVS